MQHLAPEVVAAALQARDEDQARTGAVGPLRQAAPEALPLERLREDLGRCPWGVDFRDVDWSSCLQLHL